MELKNSETEKNLRTAFSNEAKAMCKYVFYAEKAIEDNCFNVANAFEAASRNEQEHAKIWFKFYHGILSNEDNLKNAISKEHYESTEMYIRFAETARKEGFNDIAMLFESVADIEKGHEMQFKALLGEDFKTDQNWKCRKCGYVHDKTEVPNRCPVCEQYRVGGIN